MSDVNPTLLLMLALFALAALIVWGLAIYVAGGLARRGRRPLWRWVLPAILPGPFLAGAAYLARCYRRCVIFWTLAQAASIAGVIAAAVIFLPGVLGIYVALDLLLLLAGLVVAFVPVLVLAALGPRPGPRVEAARDEPLIQAHGLHKSYNLGGRRLRVLRGVSLSIRRGEFVAVFGASGSGKSTLLHLLGLLDTADAGAVVLDGADTATFRPAERNHIRCQEIGFVLQFYHLLPELNVLENMLLPAMTSVGAWRWCGSRRAARQRAREILAKLGLADRVTHRPRQLSGGEQQRVAIARALMNSPKILLADEPTGNLDSRTGGQIMKLLKQLNQETEQTIIMVTHDQAVAHMATRMLHLRDGKLVAAGRDSLGE